MNDRPSPSMLGGRVSFQNAAAAKAERSARAGRSRFSGAGEAAVGGGDEPGQRLEVVAALEHRGEARAECRAASGDLPEPCRRHLHLSQRVVGVRVEAGGDEHEIRAERPHSRLDRVLERRAVGVVSRARGQRQVQRRLVARVRPARARPERPLVERDEEDGVVAPEECLGAVAVMDIEVDDRDPLQAELLLRVPRRDGDVVQEAEAHRAAGESVMPGRPDERESASVDGFERDPGRERRRPPGRLRGDGVRVELDGPVDSLQQLQVGGFVHANELLLRRLPLDRLSVQHEQPVLPLGMVARRVQLREHRIGQEVDNASSRPLRRPKPHSPASAAARSHVGCWSSSGGSGASRSIVAMCR
jgi:hypothetical protein